MSANNYSKLNILGFQSWFNNYKATVASGEVPNPYGLTAAQETAVTSANTGYNTAVTNWQNAKTAYETALTTRNDAYAAALASVSDANGTIYANAAVDSAMLTDAGLAIHATSDSSHVPQVPTNVVGFGCQDGNEIKWSRSGNKSGIVFGIERRTPGGTWVQAGFSKQTKFEDFAATPGAQYEYRVFASNAGHPNAYSSVVIVFADGAAESLSIAA